MSNDLISRSALLKEINSYILTAPISIREGENALQERIYAS